MGICCSKFSESVNPSHHLATSSSPSLIPSVEPSLPNFMESSLPTSDEYMHRLSVEPSLEDPVFPSSPMESSLLGGPFPMESALPTLGHPGPSSPPIDAIESIRGIYEKIDPVLLMDPLFSFIENQLYKMIIPTEAGTSSSEGWLATVGESIQHAAATIDTIFNEAEKVSESDALKEIRRITLKLLEGMGQVHQVFIGLSLAAFVADRYTSVCCMEEEWKLLLPKILELAKDIKMCGEQISIEKAMLCNAVVTVMEIAVIAYDYFYGKKVFRFWSAKRAAAQLENTIQQFSDVKDSLALSPLQLHWDKDVFLCHSGKEKNFVRQLHLDLSREHISCFFDEDDNSLPIGEQFTSLIFEAAETCKAAIVVLSKEFIQSKWPMMELSAFSRAKKSGRNAKLELILLFFNISPSELSHITKGNPEWKELEVSDVTRGEWQDALEEILSISGFQLAEDGNYLKCGKKVVEKICRFLRGINSSKLLDFEPVGIEKEVQEVKALLDMKGTESALAVVIHGFGGVGKSTLAASVVQSLYRSSMDFKICKVAFDYKTQNRTSHILDLQKYILYELQGVEPDLKSLLEGRVQIKAALRKKYSLLFIDNVVDKDYVRDLLPNDLSGGEQETKLRIILTSRETNVIAELKIMCKEYAMKCLSFEASKSLLSKTILQSSMVKDKDEEGMMNEVAAACRGVPLLLSVFGMHLRVQRDESSYQKESYMEVLDVLREGNLDSYREECLGTRLLFVYNKIKDIDVKEAFLDICTYFHGWEWNLVADIVDFSKLNDLHSRTLVSKSGSGEVIVHDILRLMGVKMAKLTRFSNFKELSYALEDGLVGFRDVKGISLVNDTNLITIQSRQFEHMHQCLRVLILGDWVKLEGSPCQKVFTNLRYLRVGDITAFPFKDPPKLDKLRVFVNRSKPGMNLSHLPSSLKRISYEGAHVECDKFVKLPFQNLRSLKSLIFKTHKPVELPEELHLPESLVDLNLNKCKNLPKDIGHLTALESLILDGSDLNLLPQGCGKLRSLKHLSMNYCSKLAFLSEELGMLSSLQVLSMKSCRNLSSLPQSLGGLLSLRRIELSECINMQRLPESFGILRIQSLNLHSLVNLDELPNSFGNMTLLKDLSVESCHSLISLPNSFVQLNMLETLKIEKCTKFSRMPKDFGRLRCLKRMTVEACHNLMELPPGFGTLPVLKIFTLLSCNSFVNLPRDLGELMSLEKLYLGDLPSISRIPDGFGKLKNLRFLDVCYCSQLEALSDDFQSMATLEQLSILNCPELGGAMMEKIIKLPSCYRAHIDGSRKLLEKWEHMQGESEHSIVVVSKVSERDREEKKRTARVALLHGKCIEVKNSSDKLIERSSLLVGMEEGTIATVALFMLPIHMQSHQHRTLQHFVDMARERATSDGSGKLQIVCARKVDLDPERPTPTEEEDRAEDESIRQILLSLPKGSCAIPSSECKRVKILTYCFDLGSSRTSNDKLSIFMAKVLSDFEGRKIFENLKFTAEDEISGNVPPLSPLEMRKTDYEHYNSIQNFIKSMCPEDKDWRSQIEYDAGKNKTKDFMEALKGNGIDYLIDNNSRKVMIDDLHGKAIGFIVCDIKFLKCIKLQQIYKDLQQRDSDFIWIWIPTEMPEGGHGSYTRLIHCMPWVTFPYPQLVNIENRYSFRRTYFVLLDKHGQIANRDALPLVLAWGVKSYPFTQRTIPECFSLVKSESYLEFLLHGMNIVGRKQMKSKMTFLYAEHPRGWHKMKSKLEELTEIHGKFEVLYVGNFSERDISSIENLKSDYEDARQSMRWPSLSFSDMIIFWYRCKYLANEEAYQLYKESSIMMRLEALHGFANHLYRSQSLLVLVDNNGPVTYRGEDVVQMVCESSDKIWCGEGMGLRRVKDELFLSLSRGECTSIMKAYFRDEIHNYPQHMFQLWN